MLKLQTNRGFSLIEVMMGTAIMSITAATSYTLLWTGTQLMSKNIAMNSSHQDARLAVVRMESDIHKAVSIPQMIDVNGVTITDPLKPAAGIRFQNYATGPFQIAPDADTSAIRKTIEIQLVKSGVAGTRPLAELLAPKGGLPVIGMRLNIPTHSIEEYVTKVVINEVKGTATVTLANRLGTDVVVTMENGPVNIVCFFTDQISYKVANVFDPVSGARIDTELRRYSSRMDLTGKLICNGITTMEPFSNPLRSPTDTPQNRFVSAINLSTANSQYSNQHFKSANMFLNAQVPYRAQLTDTQ